MTAKIFRARWFRSLRARLVILISIAVLPLGLIAVQQTSAVISDAQELAESDILARTARAANAEQVLLRRAYGAATALGAAAVELDGNVGTCRAVMQHFVDQTDAFIFAGFIQADGIMRCSTGEAPQDFSSTDVWIDFLERPEPQISVNRAGYVTNESVLIATVPVFDPQSDAFLGAASVSVPHSLTDSLLSARVGGVSLALLDGDGNVLSASTGIADTEEFDNLGVRPDEFGLSASGTTFTVLREDGAEQLAALVPLIGDRVFVLGLWQGSAPGLSGGNLEMAAPIFPIVMWIIALVVLIMALDRLVLAHLASLRRKMANFSLDDPSDSFAQVEGAPEEIAEIAGTYNRMVDRILATKSELDATLVEKELLLREVHHRVKNNLQLIASILNMQLRTVPEGVANRVLRRVQDRVMSLATIHKALYTGTSMATVRADRLIVEVAQAGFSVGVPMNSGVRTRVEAVPLDLDPDLAVPLALLTTEAVTNATKYLGRPEGGDAWLEVHLREDVPGKMLLLIENTMGTPLQDVEIADGTGLGARLIEAFVSQLDGVLETSEHDGLYRVSVRFPLPRAEDGTDPDDDQDSVDPDDEI